MKKVMTALALCAIASNVVAASAEWKCLGGNILAESASSKYSGTAYVFDVGVLAQEAVFNAYSENSSYDFSAKSVGSVTIASGTFSSTANTFSYGDAGFDYSFYFVLVSDDKQALYFSNELSDKQAQTPPLVQNLSFGTQNNGTLTFSGTARADGFQGAGKWSAVPEPTSGLLMLLGFAGLALRRKQK